MTTTDQRPPEVRQQAREHADEARTRMDTMRRQRDDGIVGWLNERAGDWELSGPDEATMQRQKYFATSTQNFKNPRRQRGPHRILIPAILEVDDVGSIAVDRVIEYSRVNPRFAQEQQWQSPAVGHPRFDVGPWGYAR
jgi:hypothetical protein